MYRILRDRCGYSGYECRGLIKLTDVFRVGVFNCDSDVSGVVKVEYKSGAYEKILSTTLDNFYNIPAAVAEMAPSMEYVTDMSLNIDLVAPRIPGISCQVPTGANSNDYDLFENYGSKVVYKDTTGTDTYIAFTSELPCFTSDAKTLFPGPTTPVAPVDFDPIVPEVSADYNLSLYVENLYSDLGIFEEFLNCFDPVGEDYADTICGLEGLLEAMADSSVCDSVKISLMSGTPLARDSHVGPCIYELTNARGGGYSSIQVNGKQITFPLTVDGQSTIEAPFYLYLNINDDDNTAYISTTKGPNAIGLGGVRLVRSEAHAGISDDPPECQDMAPGAPRQKYEMYVVEQNECPESTVTPVDPPDACSVERLITAMADAPECENVSVRHADGKSIVSWTDAPDDPWRGSSGPGLPLNRYTWSCKPIPIPGNKTGQKIQIPDYAVDVSGNTDVSVYMVIEYNKNSNQWTGRFTTNPPSPSETRIIKSVGAINVVSSKNGSTAAESDSDCQNPSSGSYTTYYKVLSVSQSDCLESIMDPDDIAAAMPDPYDCDNFVMTWNEQGGGWTIGGSCIVYINGIAVGVDTSEETYWKGNVTGSRTIWMNITLTDTSANVKLSYSQSGDTSLPFATIDRAETFIMMKGTTKGWTLTQYMCMEYLTIIDLDEKGVMVWKGPGMVNPFDELEVCDDN